MSGGFDRVAATLVALHKSTNPVDEARSVATAQTATPGGSAAASVRGGEATANTSVAGGGGGEKLLMSRQGSSVGNLSRQGSSGLNV